MGILPSFIPAHISAIESRSAKLLNLREVARARLIDFDKQGRKTVKEMRDCIVSLIPRTNGETTLPTDLKTLMNLHGEDAIELSANPNSFHY